MSIRDKWVETKRFWQAMFLYHQAVFPFGAGLVIFRTLTPFVRRVIILLILLGSLRVFLATINADQPLSGSFIENAGPILWGLAAFLTIPPLVDATVLYFKRQTVERRKTAKLHAMARQIGCDVNQLKAWVSSQDRFLAYLVGMPFVYGLLLFAAEQALYAHIAAEVFFWILIAIAGSGMVSARDKLGLAVEIAGYLSFALYVLVLAYLMFVFQPPDFHIEVLFLMVMVPRIQHANMRHAARFVLNTKDVGEDEDRDT